MLRNLHFVLAGFFFMMLALLIWWLLPYLRQHEYVVANIAPTILGLVLDGLLFVGVLGILEARAEALRVAKLRQTLEGQLAFLTVVLTNRLLESEVGKYRKNVDWTDEGSVAAGLAQLLQGKNEKEKSAIEMSAINKVRSKSKVHLQRVQLLMSTVLV